MSKKNDGVELNKNERIKKHERSHGGNAKKKHDGLGRLEPKHRPNKKNHTNYLDAYEKYGEDFEEMSNQ